MVGQQLGKLWAVKRLVGSSPSTSAIFKNKIYNIEKNYLVKGVKAIYEIVLLYYLSSFEVFIQNMK